ncbi:MAG: bifunctional UDP-N-acetylmuramoyl-tripeptide:D-alanyl-D-alanine ligase/alanine racemase [Bacteroidetes bacterium B1(2017)]|nr:MAG: bifunctional UDP-N-acetylmuramoyl-tripeptide:D-alanyl-D-alanine ligase/alanine racemase [Bacteroidetes bacterium B1(2017)]
MSTIQQLQNSLQGKFIFPPSADISIANVIIDSRKLLFTENALFIAIKGSRNNSHTYLQDVYDAGIRMFIVEQGNYTLNQLSGFKDACVLEVANGISALQTIATLHRHLFTLPVLAITGSNGKTIVKEWLCHLLKDTFQLVRNPKSYNSQIGVPLSVLQIQAQHTLGIFEAGISEPNEMQNLQPIIDPSIGLLTLIGDAHNEGFESKEQKLSEKNKLFSSCKQVIYCQDQEWVHAYFTKLNTELGFKKYVSWSKQTSDATFAFSTQLIGSACLITHKNLSVQIPYTDEASIWNACTCLAFLLEQKIEVQELLPRFLDLPTLDMRLQLKEGHQNSLLINDSYSADLGSLQIALEFMQQHAGDYSKTVILSDFLESGKREGELYASIAKLLEANNITRLIGIGEAISRNKEVFKQKEVLFFDSTKLFLSHCQVTEFSAQIILIKGARSFAFERISKWLEKKVHQTIFEINLNALVHNLNTYRALLKPTVKVMAMVKAFSYGAGSYEIARILSFNRIDYLTVAYADEGVVLRKSGIKTPIMVMNPEEHSFDTILSYNLEPEIYQFQILQSLISAADGEEVGIHIELDSGMKRLGFDLNQLTQLVTVLKQNPNLKVKSVFTHLAASEDPAHDTFTLAQIDTFKAAATTLEKELGYSVLKHCLNSGGIARFPDAQCDMVRLGIGLYGVNPSEKKLPLQAIGSLKTVISQIRTIGADESIGYGRNGHLPSNGKIAIVAIGYADGLDRKLSRGVGSMLVNKQLAPIVGNICMDMTMLDVTHIDCQVGDEVVVFGAEPSIQQVSEQIGTIPYEILTGVSQRVKRVYFFE